MHNRLEEVSSKFWDRSPSLYIACMTWGLGLVFLHQMIISAALLAAMWILARHEGWRKGKRQ